MLNTKNDIFVLRPSLSALLWLASAVIFGVIIGILTWIYRDGILGGSVLFIGSMGIWLSLATTRIELSASNLTMRRFFLVVWRVGLRDLSLSEGGGDGIPILPAFIVEKNGKKVGEILKNQFTRKNLDAFQAALEREGVSLKVRDRHRQR